MVAHHLVVDENDEPAMVGFVVSKAVGNAVTRNLVKRRMRAIMAGRVDALAPGSLTVVRALPAASGADFGTLERDLGTVISRCTAPGAKARP